MRLDRALPEPGRLLPASHAEQGRGEIRLADQRVRVVLAEPPPEPAQRVPFQPSAFFRRPRSLSALATLTAHQSAKG